MTATEKLYWSDAHASSFEIRGATLAMRAGKPALVLAGTMFYPEGGGQLGDSGTVTLGKHAVRIADTQIEDGAIFHIVDGDLTSDVVELLRAPEAADLQVRGAIDEAKRRDHMVQHTAQHALSRALADAARADTVSARLGASTCTIDVSRPGIKDADLHRAEDLVNGIVMSDVPVVTSFPTPEQLAELELRKQPNAEKSQHGVRVVAIEGFDVTPCGGTHCTRTGQIGQVRIAATEKYKGMLRITFHAGQRALADARARHELLATLAAQLTCGAEDLPVAITKLRNDLKGAREKLDGARTELADLVARRLRESLPGSAGPHVLPVARPLDDLATLRALAGKLTEDPRVVALVAGQDADSGEVVLVVQRGVDAKLDCGAFVMAEARARGGRGGGRPERAEGRFPRDTSLDDLGKAANAASGAPASGP
jgi:alanyl-tRNA synthetase